MWIVRALFGLKDRVLVSCAWAMPGLFGLMWMGGSWLGFVVAWFVTDVGVVISAV